MMRVIVSIAIMLISAFAGAFVGARFNGVGTFAMLFAMIAGFACTIQAIEVKKESKKKD